MYDAYPGDGEEGLPREWMTTTVGDAQPFDTWRTTDSQPDGYAVGYEDSEQYCILYSCYLLYCYPLK